MKANAFECPKCAGLPDPERYTYELVEPAEAFRKLAFTVVAGAITNIETTDVEHDDASGDRELIHRECGTRFPIPEGFWAFDVYG